MSSQKNNKSQIRIIGGKLRGSKISVPAVTGLRPTPDRVRETVFNWLADDCRGATVLDCFCGSGVLAIESLSRGAAWVTMIEQNRLAWQNLKQQVQRFTIDKAEVLNGNALSLIENLKHQYSLVFVDPPYASSGMRETVLQNLIENGRLDDVAQIYLEWPEGDTVELDHPGLTWRKHKKAGQVHYAIAEWRLSR